MGTKVMVRATRSFNGRAENEWYYVDPDDPHIRALISGGYFAHQETLIDVPAPAAAPDPAGVPPRKGRQRGKVEAEPSGDHPDGTS